MCDASDYVVGAILGQREEEKPYVVYYASKTLNDAQKTTQLLKKSSFQWCSHLINSGATFWEL